MVTLAFLLFLVAALAFLGAGVFPWVLHGAAIAAAAGSLALGLRDRARTSVSYCGVVGAALVGFVLLTAIPLPRFLDGLAGSHRSAHNEMARNAIDKAQEVGLVASSGQSQSFCLSRNKAGALQMALLLITGFCAGAMASRMTGLSRKRCLAGLVVAGTLIAALGFAGQWLWKQDKTIWWLFAVPHGHPVGCFVNRNHFGGFVAMLCPAAVALAVDALERRRWINIVFWVACFCVMSFAVVMSLSRGAWISYSVAMTAISAWLLWRRRLMAGGVASVAVAVVLVTAWIFRGSELSERVESLEDPMSASSAQMRISTWNDTLDIFGDYPVIGSGANSLRAVFPQYRTASTTPQFRYAENEYVQVAAEGGMVGLLLSGFFLVCVLRAGRRSAPQDGRFSPLSMAAAGAAIVAAVHAGVDFALRVPLYYVVLCLLVGLAIRGENRNEQEARRGSVFCGFRPIAATIIVLILYIPGWRVYRMDESDYLAKANADELCRAMTWSPSSWQVWYNLGLRAVEKGSPEAIRFGEECISRAAGYDPNNYRVWKELARLRLFLGDRRGAREAYIHVRMLRSWVRIQELDSK